MTADNLESIELCDDKKQSFRQITFRYIHRLATHFIAFSDRRVLIPAYGISRVAIGRIDNVRERHLSARLQTVDE